MKRTVLVVLMLVMIGTPCLAQEVETDGLFSIDGTLWGMCYTYLILPADSQQKIFHECPFSQTIGFYKQAVYWCDESGRCWEDSTHTYIDLLLFSIVIMPNPPGATRGYALHMLSPTIGLGFLTVFQITPGNPIFYLDYGIGIMFKVDNNWTPPDVE